MQQQCSVTLLPENITVTVPHGTSLLMAARQAGIDIESPCGGAGTCGKCAVKLVRGEVDGGASFNMSADLREAGYILSCKAQVKGDVTIEVPLFSRLTGHKVVTDGRSAKYSRENDYFAGKKLDPLCKKYFLKLAAPGLDDCMNDLDRVKTTLQKEYGLGPVTMGLGTLRQLPEVLRQGDWEVTVTVLETGTLPEIVRLEPGKSQRPAYGISVDIGTTTVVVNLVDLESGKVVERAGTYNKQAAFGSDVISRIIHAEEKEEGLDQLHRAVVGTINSLIEGLLEKTGINREELLVAVCAGNTVMTHLFLKVSAAYLRLEPYVPAAVDFPPVKAGELYLAVNPEAVVVTVPSVASYVGGDITAGVLATQFAHSDALTLFIDVGTNGELVLGNRDWLVTCSCSAGPAFEGSGIRCGMRAMDGAIDRIDIDRETMEVSCRTVGGTRPLGICGSGLIYSLSEMMEAGIIDRAGKILENLCSPRIRKGEEGMEYLLVAAEESGTGQDITLTEGDVKNLLRAKGAVFAGIRTMLHQLQLDVDAIDRVMIAGGFGSYINITDAVHIGLLPDLPEERFDYVGNSSVQGATLVLLSKAAWKEARELAARMTYIELSVGNLFMEEFISALFIPHTDLHLFPSVGKNKQSEQVGMR